MVIEWDVGVNVGEAKVRREQLRQKMLVELDRWMTPSLPEEDALNDEIRNLRFYRVNRAPPDQLAYMRMEPQQCHQNAGAYVRLDPSGESRHVSGWWKRGAIFFFHSVILTQTKLFCVTPHHDSSPLEFAPDFEIAWIEADGVMNSNRRGKPVPFLVRDFPEQVIREATAARESLVAGADPRSIKLLM
ncbi:hypothetical protein [Sphingomonas sp. PAMC 26617]|uniref:hypothetical protein n=1 Tax=Sphingomonas sp. PAMC 26617 TaxID=1112216 RepID=UPI000288DA7F|nr:hypothetical protein [Sphingomonas sp. PAMC 26617]